MNIVYIAPKIPYGGAERQMMELAKIGAEKGYNVEILELSGKDERIIDGVKIKGLDQKVFFEEYSKAERYLNLLKALLAVKSYLKDREVDYVVIFGRIYVFLKLFIKNKMLFSVREFNQAYFKGVSRKMLEKMDLVTANSYPSYLYAKKINSRSYLVNNISEPGNISSVRIKNKRYLMVSNISERKNILPAVQAFKELEAEGYSLDIVGKVVEEHYNQRILSAAEESGNIKFHGFLNSGEIEQLYNGCEGVIHLSLLEGTPNAVLDAVKYSKPFLCLDTPENIAFVGEIGEYIAGENENIKKRVIQLHNIIDKDADRIDSIDKYLKEKISRTYSRKNGDAFYSLLEGGR